MYQVFSKFHISNDNKPETETGRVLLPKVYTDPMLWNMFEQMEAELPTMGFSRVSLMEGVIYRLSSNACDSHSMELITTVFDQASAVLADVNNKILVDVFNECKYIDSHRTSLEAMWNEVHQDVHKTLSKLNRHPVFDIPFSLIEFDRPSESPVLWFEKSEVDDDVLKAAGYKRDYRGQLL